MHRLAARSISSVRVTSGSRRATLVFGMSWIISFEYVLTFGLIPELGGDAKLTEVDGTRLDEVVVFDELE